MRGGAGVACAPGGAVRRRHRRRRGQPGRDQPARPRHRQHGLCRGGRLPGDPGRRHRPRRRVRAPRRHAGLLVAQRARPRGRLRHQPLPRRHRAAAIRAWIGSSARPASRCWACCRTCTACTSTPRTHCRPGASAGLRRGCASPCRRCRASATTPTSMRCARIRRSTSSFVGPGEAPPPCDLVILPGSKSTRADLAWLRATWLGRRHRAPPALRRQGDRASAAASRCWATACTIRWASRATPDPATGLGWLDMHTTLQPHKQLREVRGRLAFADACVRGYEIHCGTTEGAGARRARDHPR